ncbi:MAG: FeS-binding protein [Clostridia bacterium]|nr:FeS-binding protein [Clostridia bacterium]
MIELLQQEMLKEGYRLSQVSIEHLKDLETEIEKLNHNGYMDKNLYSWLKGYYNFSLPETKHNITSIVVVASLSPTVKVFFRWKGKRIPLIMPPTYLDFDREPKEIKKRICELVGISNYHFVEAANLPNKLLAARSGLGVYGRNNIVYVPGLGSLILISAFYSDLPCNNNNWVEIQRMKSCEKCVACVTSCPTGAILPERFTIKAESCLTYHNEFWGEPDFPEWIDPSSHNSIVGCMKCQIACPQNKEHTKNVIELEEFNDEETAALIEKRAVEDLPSSMVSKLERLNLHIHYHYLSRNLKALLEKEALWNLS